MSPKSTVFIVMTTRPVFGTFLKSWKITANERQPWTNDENNGYECLLIGAVVRPEYSNIRYLYLITGNVQKSVWGHKNRFQEQKSHFHCELAFAIFDPIINKSTGIIK